jgi:hypothetical protein
MPTKRRPNSTVDALHSHGPTGPDPEVSDAQLAEVEQVLLQGAIAAGFDTHLWTLERVATVIEASERDEQAIARRVAHEWPRIKNGQPQNRPGLSSTNRQSR